MYWVTPEPHPHPSPIIFDSSEWEEYKFEVMNIDPT